jgi:hypothetical protein
MKEEIIRKHQGWFENRTAKNWDAEILLKDFYDEVYNQAIKDAIEICEGYTAQSIEGVNDFMKGKHHSAIAIKRALQKLEKK